MRAEELFFGVALLRGLGYMLLSFLVAVNGQVEVSRRNRAGNRSRSHCHSRTSVELNDIPSKSPKTSPRAYISTPHWEIRHSRLDSALYCRSVCLSARGSDLSFTSCNPLAPVFVNRGD
jgi:hypothetical protein